MSQDDEKAAKYPMLAMVGEGHDAYYMRAVEHKGLVNQNG